MSSCRTQASGGGASQGLSGPLLGLDNHSFFTDAVQLEHHNFQELFSPLEYLELVHDLHAVPVAQVNRPEVFLALSDNVTCVSLMMKHRTRSLPLAAEWLRHTVSFHHWGWHVQARHIDKHTMDSVYQVDARGRVHSSIHDRGLPPFLLVQLRVALADAIDSPLELVQPPLLDLFATHTVRCSDRYVTPTHECREPKPLWINALSPLKSWSHRRNRLIPSDCLLYLFPPTPLLDRVLDRLLQDCCDFVLLVAPWISRSPRARILAMSISPTVFFSISPDEMIPPEGRLTAPPLGSRRVTYVATILSCKPWASEGMTSPPSTGFFADATLRARRTASSPTTLDGHAGSLSSIAEATIRFLSPPPTSPSSSSM